MSSAWEQLRAWARDARVPIGRSPERPPAAERRVPDWVAANPARIRRAAEAAAARTAGGWYALDDRRAVGRRPRGMVVAGRELVVWRDDDGLHVAPGACPHMGASLAGAEVRDGCLVCPWHGLALDDGRAHRAFRHLPMHDDGTLLWVRLPDHDAPTTAPVLPLRPADALAAVVRLEGACEPQHIVANRLDPWHGAHFHPYAFVDLDVVAADDDRLRLHVGYRVLGPVVVNVVAEFTTPSSRCVAMHIVEGEGQGSLVETHATPLAPGRSAVVEATFATSGRAGFGWARRLAPVIRPAMAHMARRLWVDDLAYAERVATLAGAAPATSERLCAVPAEAHRPPPEARGR